MTPCIFMNEADNTMGTTHGFTTQLKKQTLQTQSWTVSLPRLTLLSLPWGPLSWLSMWPYHAFSFFPLKRKKKKGSVGFFFFNLIYDGFFKMLVRRCQRHRFYPWVRKIPRSRKWQPSPVFLPRKFHGQRSLAGYSPWDCKDSDTT